MLEVSSDRCIIKKCMCITITAHLRCVTAHVAHVTYVQCKLVVVVMEL